jgi:hypothetical protein
MTSTAEAHAIAEARDRERGSHLGFARPTEDGIAAEMTLGGEKTLETEAAVRVRLILTLAAAVPTADLARLH